MRDCFLGIGNGTTHIYIYMYIYIYIISFKKYITHLLEMVHLSRNIMESREVRGGGVSSLSYKSLIRTYRMISPTQGKNLSLLPGPTMNETRDPSSRFIQGWLKTDKGLLRGYPGFKG